MFWVEYISTVIVNLMFVYYKGNYVVLIILFI
jgi:hypothetical protein